MHQPVLLTEAIDALNLRPDGFYVDGTFGRGGHSAVILSKLGPKGRLWVLDKDLAAIEHAHSMFRGDARVSIIHDSYSNLQSHLRQAGLLGAVDGILLDLGISSPQLDQAERGFSFMHAGPLDMRMDNSQGKPLSVLLSQVEEADLVQVLFRYGEEKQARRIARNILEAVQAQTLHTTRDLAEVVSAALPSRFVLGKHPATRTFQALRIWVNQELTDLEVFLEAVDPLLVSGGRLAVISFHSLEDRVVKHAFQAKVQGPELPRRLPIQTSAMAVSKFTWCEKQIKPTEAETSRNSRARSAILRVIQRS